MVNCSSELFVTQRGKTSPILKGFAMHLHHYTMLCSLTQHFCIDCRAVGLSFKHMNKLLNLRHCVMRILFSAKALHWAAQTESIPKLDRKWGISYGRSWKALCVWLIKILLDRSELTTFTLIPWSLQMIQVFPGVCNKSSAAKVKESYAVFHFWTIETFSVKTLRK